MTPKQIRELALLAGNMINFMQKEDMGSVELQMANLLVEVGAGSFEGVGEFFEVNTDFELKPNGN